MGNLKDIGYGVGKYLTASDASGIPGIGNNRKNLDLLNFKVATNNAYNLYNFKDGMIDAYQTQEGIDTAGSSAEVYDSANKSYSKSTGIVEVTASGNITTNSTDTSMKLLVVGGGGSGGLNTGGGGGAGSLYYNASYTVIANTTYAITIGPGGSGGSGGVPGTNTVFDTGGVSSTITAPGGGGGGGWSSPNNPGQSGGSGGGGSAGYNGGGTSGPNTNSGGAGKTGGPGYGGGGGGGAGGSGADGSTPSPGPYMGGNGGVGVDYTAVFGTDFGDGGWFAGGGGGGQEPQPGTGGAGGKGGGGRGSTYPDSPAAEAGYPNTGGGGGANTGANYGLGGSGVVIYQQPVTGMTLKSTAQTAVGDDPTEGRLMLYEEDVDSITLDTDIKGYVSRDGGTTYTQTPLVEDTVYAVANQGGIDPYTKLMLHCDGSNNGTTFTDSSDSAHTITVSGDTHTDTSVKKFGTASAQFDGSDYLRCPYSTDFDFGTDNFTLDTWVYLDNVNSNHQLIATGNSNWNGKLSWLLDVNPSSAKLRFHMNNASTTSFNLWGNTAIVVSTWTHVAMVRNGNTGTIYVNGVADATTDMSGWTSFVLATDNYVDLGHAGHGAFLTGYLDEVRISKGVARWTEDFVVATRLSAAYSLGNYLAGPTRLLSGSVDISGQPSGTDMKYKVETLNSKNLKLHGASLLWA